MVQGKKYKNQANKEATKTGATGGGERKGKDSEEISIKYTLLTWTYKLCLKHLCKQACSTQ